MNCGADELAFVIRPMEVAGAIVRTVELDRPDWLPWNYRSGAVWRCVTETSLRARVEPSGDVDMLPKGEEVWALDEALRPINTGRITANQWLERWEEIHGR
jgi:hypothetical protein